MSRPYGNPEGLSDRLREWSERLGKDRQFPWVGLGLFKDLEAAANILEGKPTAPKMEFDL